MTLSLDTLWNATITEDAVTFKVKGLWNSNLRNKTEIPIDTPLSPMKTYDRRIPNTGQIYCNAYCIESFFDTMIYGNPGFGFRVTPDEIPDSFPAKL